MALAALALMTISACGEVEKATNKVENAVTESVLSSFEDKNSFKADLKSSPLGFGKFDARMSGVDFSTKGADGRRKLDIKGGDTTLNLGLGSTNRLHGIRVTIHNWKGETGEIPILNPKETPDDGSVFAIVAYSEVQRGNTSDSRHQDWFTYRTTGGMIELTAAKAGKDGGVKGSIDFTVLLMDVQQPRPASIDALPEVHFKGTFNIRPDNSSPFL